MLKFIKKLFGMAQQEIIVEVKKNLECSDILKDVLVEDLPVKKKRKEPKEKKVVKEKKEELLPTVELPKKRGRPKKVK